MQGSDTELTSSEVLSKRHGIRFYLNYILLGFYCWDEKHTALIKFRLSTDYWLRLATLLVFEKAMFMLQTAS